MRQYVTFEEFLTICHFFVNFLALNELEMHQLGGVKVGILAAYIIGAKALSYSKGDEDMTFYNLVPYRRRHMGLASRQPEVDVVNAFHQEVDRLLASAFEDLGMLAPWRSGADGKSLHCPAMNVSESDKEVVVSVELPGVEEKNVKIELEDNVLTISGEMEEEQEQKDKRWTRVERRSGGFRRTLALPSDIREDDVQAEFKQGVLTVTLPKAEPEKPKRKLIEIK